MVALQLNSSWTPPLGSDVLYTEYTWFSGIFGQAVGYGVIIPLAVQCEVFLYKSLSRTNARNKLAWMFIVFILFVCATVCAAADERMGELSFIYYRNYPGGPSAFELDFNSLPVNGIGNVFLVLADWICDGVQLWRCYVLYSSSVTSVWIIMTIPCLAYLATIALGGLWAFQVTQPNSNSFIATSINWTAPYLGLTLALNVVISTALVVRLLHHRWQLRRAGLGSSTYGGVNYLGIAAMIIESAAIYSTFSLLSLVFFLTNRSVQNFFDPLFIMAEIIAALLIIYRVASGSAWSSNTASMLYSANSRSISFAEDGRRMELTKVTSSNAASSKTKLSSFGNGSGLMPSLKEGKASRD